MRRLLVSAVLTVAMVAGSGVQASAAPPDPTPGSGWRTAGGTTLTWTAPRIVMGGAAVEFYAGDRLLGRPATTDHRTFTLRVGKPVDPAKLQVRAGGRRLDAPPPRAERAAAAPAVPAPGRPAAVDPGVPGPYATSTGEYTLDPVRMPDYPEPVEMQAVVVAPTGAPGPRPLALFLHGRHYTCFRGADLEQVTGDWPCPETHEVVPSHRGYLEAQRLLASQGYLTVSISANGINAQDGENEDGGGQARSSLVRLHLDRWAHWAGAGHSSAPPVVRAAPRADLSRVLLVGHSRGGEGVNRAAMDSLRPPPAAQDAYHGRVRWTIRGLLLIGPTIFGHNPAPDVPSATILPGCDGDVADLQGQMYVDATDRVSRGLALHSALYTVGANHNYFNTEWTPGQAVAPALDDFPEDLPDPVCSPGTPTRLTAAQQQQVGATYVAAAARLFVGGDDRVRPLLDGTGVRAPSADPARVLSHAIGAGRTPLIVPEDRVRAGGAGRICAEVTDEPTRVCLTAPEDAWWSPSPHFVPFVSRREPGRSAVAMRWSAPGQTVTLRPARAVPVDGDLAMRIMVPPNTMGTRFEVAVTDDRGRRTDLGEVRVDGLPGTDVVTPYWAQEVRVPLPKPQSIAELELVPRGGAGQAWLIDAWGWRPGTPAPRPVALPRIDVGTLGEVPEGDSGTRTYRMPVRVTGRGSGEVRVFVADELTGETRSWLVSVRPDTRSIEVPVQVVADDQYTGHRYKIVGLKAVRGLLIGDYVGLLYVAEDDPPPTVTITPVADRVAEGGTLTWRVTMAEAAGAEVFVYGVPLPLDGPELSSTDVDPEWFRQYSTQNPEPSRPLSETYVASVAVLAPGELTAEMIVPTVTDDLDEPDEQVRLDVYVSGAETPFTTVTGTVTDGGP
jgi:hypothetical protein